MRNTVCIIIRCLLPVVSWVSCVASCIPACVPLLSSAFLPPHHSRHPVVVMVLSQWASGPCQHWRPAVGALAGRCSHSVQSVCLDAVREKLYKYIYFNFRNICYNLCQTKSFFKKKKYKVYLIHNQDKN